VLARAKNGTAKTAAFCIPILQRVDPTKRIIQAMVLVPTRELAMQTASVLKSLGKHLGVEVVSITGGTLTSDDILRLQAPAGVHIVVGTPGRIQQLAARRIAKLDKCFVVALDEADKLLSADFVGPIEEMLAASFPKGKTQVLLFSATFPAEVVRFRDKWMPAPYEINLMDVRGGRHGSLLCLCDDAALMPPPPHACRS